MEKVDGKSRKEQNSGVWRTGTGETDEVQEGKQEGIAEDKMDKSHVGRRNAK